MKPWSRDNVSIWIEAAPDVVYCVHIGSPDMAAVGPRGWPQAACAQTADGLGGRLPDGFR